MTEASEFQRKVAQIIREIPVGTVLGYGEVAMLAGRPGGARAVVRALRADALSDVPWWRVVRADRTLAEEVAVEQARRLRAEGVRVEGRRIVRPTPLEQGRSRARSRRSG